MYAPVEPASRHQPLDLEVRRRAQSTSSPPPRDSKRATWNGSLYGSPTKRYGHLQHGSDLIALFPQMGRSHNSAPTTPSKEPISGDLDSVNGQPPSEMELTPMFGAEALRLRRDRRMNGLNELHVPSPTRATPGGSGISSPSSRSSVRFSTLQSTPPNPLSALGLLRAAENAAAARRYTCAHLLALRFSDADDPTYWEDVRSAMALITSALDDASSAVSAIMNAQGEQVYGIPATTPRTPSPITLPSLPTLTERLGEGAVRGFAPVPSSLARFASHIDSMSTALNVARENLKECVEQIRSHTPVSAAAVQEAPAMVAYEHLRRELGLALRECERGREQILNILSEPQQPEEDLREDVEQEHEADDLPALGHDTTSEESDHLPSSSLLEASKLLLVTPPQQNMSLPHDDASAHLLLNASAAHLPPVGLEQVFEAEPESFAPLFRERSKLSREERIRLAKTRRETRSGIAAGAASEEEKTQHPRENWGPGGEVVQELKDVIWQVGEKRRRMTGTRVGGDEDGLPAPVS